MPRRLLCAIVLVLLILALGRAYLGIAPSPAPLMESGQAAAPGEERDPPGSVHYLFTATFDVQGRIVTGSAVQRLTRTSTGDSGAGTVPAGFARVKGQAIVIPLASGNQGPALILPMFLRRAEDLYRYLLIDACDLSDYAAKNYDDLTEVLMRIKGPCQISLEKLPPVMRIANRNDPNSMLEIAKADLASANPSGIRFVSASVMPTTLPFSYSISELLPFIPPPGAPAWKDRINFGKAPFDPTWPTEPFTDLAFFRNGTR